MSYLVGIPFSASIVEGSMEGYSPWSISGASEITTLDDDIWSWTAQYYIFPTTPQRMLIVSSNSADAATGNGARAVRIYYLDGNFAEQYEDITLNGLTAVQTTAINLFRIIDFRVTSAGISNKNAGNISLRNTAGTVTYGYIETGKNKCAQCIYTVPAGYNLIVTQIHVGIGAIGLSPKYCKFLLKANYDERADVVLPPEFYLPFFDFIQTAGGVVSIDLNTPLRFPTHTDIKMVGGTNDNSAFATCILKGWLQVQ